MQGPAAGDELCRFLNAAELFAPARLPLPLLRSAPATAAYDAGPCLAAAKLFGLTAKEANSSELHA